MVTIWAFLKEEKEVITVTKRMRKELIKRRYAYMGIIKHALKVFKGSKIVRMYE
jgi:hypothetical protein